jgi:ssDNA-binding replication factor A large subunit
MTSDAIIQEILNKHPELSKDQILTRLSAERSMTGGLIADESLLRMIAAQLGVEIANEDGAFTRRLSLGHIVAGLNNATVVGRVLAVFPVRSFEGAKPGKFGSVTIADNDGVLRVVLWNEKTSILESGELKVGQIVKFSHGYTKADKLGSPELHIGERSQIDLAPANVNGADYPSIDKLATKISALTINTSVNLQGKIKEVFGSTTFIRAEQSQGKVLRLQIGDETGDVTVVFWNEKVDEVEAKARRNATIEIVNAKVKSSQNGEVEVHVDFGTYVNIATVARCLTKISALKEDLGDVCVEGQVMTLPICKEVKTGKGELVKVTNFDLGDGTGSVRVNLWREHAEAASKLLIGEKITLENFYTRKGYTDKIELSTRTTSVISHRLD